MRNINYSFTQYGGLDDEACKELLSYLRDGLKDKTIIEFNDYYLDIKTLSQKTCLSKCLSCNKYGSVCCDGSPSSMSELQQKALEERFDDIINPLHNKGDIIKSSVDGIVNLDGEIITNSKGDCLFSIRNKDGSVLCAIHKWCLENDVNPMFIKPYGCFLFPIDCIDIDDKKFLFAIDKTTEKFGKYSYEDDKICFNTDLLGSEKHCCDYIYKEQKEVIINLFGKLLYDYIDDIVRSR